MCKLLSGCVTQGGLGTHQKNPLSLPKTGFFPVPSLEGSGEGDPGELKGSQWITTKATLLSAVVGEDGVTPGTWYLALVFCLSSGRPLRPGTCT